MAADKPPVRPCRNTDAHLAHDYAPGPASIHVTARCPGVTAQDPTGANARASALYRELKLALAEVHEDDRAEALGPHPMVGKIDCELCGEGVCHYLHITQEEADRRVAA